jgi:hypothetical protein
VFDGNYNNLTNKPSLITTTDITYTSNYVLRLDGNTSNYVARINTTLTAADTALGVRIDNTSNYVLRLDGHTSNYVARINSELTTSIGTKQATLTAGTNISIVGTTISASASSFTPTSANMIGVFNPNDFVNNVGTSKIDLSPHTSNYVARINTTLTAADTALGVRIDNTSNYVASVNTTLTTAMGTLQPKIISTAGQLIIGNGDGFTTTNTGLTWTGGATNLLTATNISGNGSAITALNMGNALTGTLAVGRGGTGGTTFTAGQLLIGNTTSVFSQVAGLTWTTATNLLTATNISGNGSAITALNMDSALTGTLTVGRGGTGGTTFTAGQLLIGNTTSVFSQVAGLTWTSATNLLSATNLAVSGTSTLTGNVGIGTTALTNILQVGSGGRLRISNGTTDYTTIGTLDVDGATNTSIVISGTTRSTNAGNIQYLATATGGSHIFYTASTTTRMTISSTGVNVNNSLGVGERVGIGTSPHATYRLDIQGTQPRLRLLDPSAIGGNSVIMFRELSDLYGMDITYIGDIDKRMYITSFNNSATPVIRVAIDRNTGNVGIGSSAPAVKLDVVGAVYINNGNVDDALLKLLVVGSDANTCAARFFHPNRSQGIGITFDGLRALAPSGNQDIWMRPLGTGMFQVGTSTFSTLIGGGYLNAGGASGGSITWPAICAKFNGVVWSTNAFVASSDSRIKEDIQDINDDDALNKLLSIEPKTYKYIDKRTRGDTKVYGFIAQQIREVIPEAVKIEKSYIPNIMLIGDFNDYIITLPSQPEKVIINVNDNIRCLYDNGEEILVKVEEVIDELTFKIKAIDDIQILDYTDSKIFVYGTEIDDFHTLSKEYIFTLNVCATQELHRRIISQEERIKELETKMEDILKYLSL